MDAIVGKRLAREQRKWEREQAQRQAEAQTLRAPAEILPVDQFQSPEAYAEALALQKAEQLIAQREQARQQAAILESYHEKEEEDRNKFDEKNIMIIESSIIKRHKTALITTKG